MPPQKKTEPAAPPALNLPPLEPPRVPERPASKVEQGLASSPPSTDPAGLGQEELDRRAVGAMVAAGLSEEQARAALALAREEPAAVVEAAERPSTDAPICPKCFGPDWSGVKPHLASVSCEHGTWPRDPEAK